MATITRKPRMNRVYITGKTDKLRNLLSDFHARTASEPCDPHPCEMCAASGKSRWATDCHGCDGSGTRSRSTVYWLPLHQEGKLRAAIKAETEYQQKLAVEL